MKLLLYKALITNILVTAHCSLLTVEERYCEVLTIWTKGTMKTVRTGTLLPESLATQLFRDLIDTLSDRATPTDTAARSR